ncbi:hypothetical protein [Rodentibacter caecimuris]|uniref:Lipoprotein n=1 Tax=Rodentibacter caecimuris TaxID=1796644 RepID=A0ABX3KVS0_9PAST|nr:hypothetical protein BKG89_09190 [Rodentibacter heylii]
MKKTTLFLTTLLLTSCAASDGTNLKSRKPFNINGYEKRLNIATCNDMDDWYLDGFGVGHKYAAYKQKILEQRITYCGDVSKNFVMAWEDGFNQGTKNLSKTAKRIKKAKRTRANHKS